MAARNQVRPEDCTPEQLAAAMRLFDKIYELNQKLKKRKEEKARLKAD